MLDSAAGIEEWYYSPNLYYRDRYFVLAMAALEGAPRMVVAQAALEIEKRFKKPKKEAKQEDAPDPSPRSQMARTFTMSRRIGNAERIFWQRPELIVRMREFVTEQLAGMGQEREFLEILHDWSTEGISERTVRAIKMLAFVYWKQDQNGLYNLARAWAPSNRWFHAAALMAGAYEAEYDAAVLEAIQREDQEAIANPLPQSKVLARLQQWARPQSAVALKRVAFYAYGLLGRRWPILALDALESALNAGKDGRGMVMNHDTVFDGMTSYAIIAWGGHLRAVLDRLAQIVQRFLDHPRGVVALRNITQRAEHELPLAVVFTAFALIALSSLSDTTTTVTYDLHKPLPEHPEVPLPDGRDTVLAGLLSAVEPEMRRDIVALLAAAIVEHQLDLAFKLIRLWAIATWDEPEDKEVRAAFITRIKQVIKQIQQDVLPETATPAIRELQRQLETWSKPLHEKRASVNRFALEMLQAFSKR